MKRFVWLAVVFALVGCAGTQSVPIDKSALPGLTGKSLAVVNHEQPSFLAMTSTKGAFAVLGVAAAATAGNQLVKDKGINDPALAIGQQLAQELNNRFALTFDEEAPKMADSTNLKTVAQVAGTDYALDMQTLGWSFIYDGFNFSEYIVGYSAKLKLIDVPSQKVISSGFCAYDTKKAGKPNVSYETLMANDAAYIKQVMGDATSFCVDKFKTELF